MNYSGMQEVIGKNAVIMRNRCFSVVIGRGLRMMCLAYVA